MTDEPKAPVWTRPHDDTPEHPHTNTPATAPPPITEIDAAVERVAFAELVAFITAHKDESTEVTHISADEFAATLE